MKWFYRWLEKKVRQAHESEVVCEERYSNRLVGSAHPIRTPDSVGLHFILYPANGGNILEVRQHDCRKGSDNVSLHIIKNDEDIGESISKIITYEALQR